MTSLVTSLVLLKDRWGQVFQWCCLQLKSKWKNRRWDFLDTRWSRDSSVRETHFLLRGVSPPQSQLITLSSLSTTLWTSIHSFSSFLFSVYIDLLWWMCLSMLRGQCPHIWSIRVHVEVRKDVQHPHKSWTLVHFQAHLNTCRLITTSSISLRPESNIHQLQQIQIRKWWTCVRGDFRTGELDPWFVSGSRVETTSQLWAS